MQKVDPQAGQSIASNIFFEAALREVPRLLGQIDRNPLSKTYGSCDRAFWLYRTNDISSMRYQEAALTLALLYATPFEGNGYCGDDRLKSWANAVIRFACMRQHRNGSFDEWYLHEGSFVCTAFVSAALSEAALVLGGALEDTEQVMAMLKASGRWLAHHTETLVVNQLAGAVCALHTIHKVTGDAACKEAAEEKYAVLLSLQHEEGWWSEYGGPDAGYVSLTIDHLSRYAERAHDAQAWSAIEKASAFLLHCLNPDGTAGGEYLSRNTEYLIPSGFFRSATHCESARRIASHVARMHAEDIGITPRSLDDRYICYILYNWIEAGIVQSTLEHRPALPTVVLQKFSDTFFPDAGLFVGSGGAYQIFVNLKKGGSLRLYTRDSVLIDSGINVCLSGHVYVGNVLDSNTEISYDESTRTLRSAGALIRVQAPLLTTGRAIGLKSAQWVFGRIPALQKLLKRTLRMASVMRPGSPSPLRYERIISLQADAVTITDTLNAALPRDSLVVGEANTYALVPSSRYVATGALLAYLRPQSEVYELTGGTTRLTRTFTV